MDSSADNYDASANTDNGLCQYLGCTDESAFNYDASANVNDGSCIDVVLGCMDALALNYNVAANTDDGSCIEVVSGCTDDGAINYNSNANVDDGSCIMPAAGFEIVNSNTGNNALIYIDAMLFHLMRVIILVHSLLMKMVMSNVLVYCHGILWTI